MKICYVVTLSATIEAFFIPQLKYLAKCGHDVTVVCSPSSTLKDQLGESVVFHPIVIPRGISIFGSLSAIQALTCFFKQEKFDLIQYSTPNAALYASIAAKYAGCKVRNYHLMGLRYLGAGGIGRGILKTLEKTACRYSTSIECVSKSNMEMGIKEGLFPPDKVTVVWNGSSGGVDLRRFDYAQREKWRSEVRRELGCGETDFIYGFAGRITKDKGVNELFDAFFRLNTDAKLCLIGHMEEDQTLNTELLEKARSSSNIIFHNFVKDIERYYAAFDVLVLPSYREGFGNVVIEAGAVGTPAIVSDIPGPTDAIDRDKTALVVPVRSAKALAEAMRKIRTMDVLKLGKAAADYSAGHFDSEELNKKIAERKRILLEIS